MAAEKYPCLTCKAQRELHRLSAFEKRIKSGKEWLRLDKTIAGLKDSLSKAKDALLQKTAELRKAMDAKEGLERENASLKDECTALKDKCVQQEGRIGELTTRLASYKKMAGGEFAPAPVQKDGTNSGCPTSKTPPGKKKVIPATERNKAGKEGGGGCPRFGEDFDENDPGVVHETKRPESSVCPCCGKEMVSHGVIKRHVKSIEVNVVNKVVEFEVLKCQECGREVHEDIPEWMQGSVSYDPSVKALVAYLNDVCNVPMRKISDIVKSITGGKLSMAASFAAKVNQRAAEGLAKFMGSLYLGVVSLTMLHWDDTVAPVRGMQACLRFYGDEHISYYQGHISKNMLSIVFDNVLTVLDESVVVVHDHVVGNYNDRFSFMNAECVVHLLRAFLYNSALTGHVWSDGMVTLIREAIHDRNEAMEKGAKSFSDEYLALFWMVFGKMIDLAEREYAEAVERHEECKEEAALVRRLRNYTANYFAWVACFDIVVSNNLAERALRIAKGKLAVAGQFQTLDALFDYAAILSYLETCKKNGVNLFDALKRLFEGNPVMPEEMLPKEIVERMRETRQKYMLDDQGENGDGDNAEARPDSEAAAGTGPKPENEQKDDAGIEAEANADKETDPFEREREIHEFLSHPRTLEELAGLLGERGKPKKMFGKGYVPGIQYMEPDRQKKPGGKGKKKADDKEAGNKNENETGAEADGETDSGDMPGEDSGKEKKRPMTDDDTPQRLRRKKKRKGKPGRPRKQQPGQATQGAPPG